MIFLVILWNYMYSENALLIFYLILVIFFLFMILVRNKESLGMNICT